MSCVARAKITVSPGGHRDVGRSHSWTINRGEGCELRGGRWLQARMQYRIIPDEEAGPFRVTTEGYAYSLDDASGVELFSIHWHPLGVSTYVKPHLHLPRPVSTPSGLVEAGGHLPVSRMSFEQAIRWSIEWGAQPRVDDWQDRLDLAESPHVLHRRWHVEPGH